MVEGAAMNAECKLVNEILLGDHFMLVGEVVQASHNSTIRPLVLHAGSYWMLDTPLQRPSQHERSKQQEVLEKHKRDS